MSTPSEPGQPHDGPALEPIRVLRPRRTDALAELFRELTQDAAGYESVAAPAPSRAGAEDETRELPPVGRRVRPPEGKALRRAAVVVAVTAAALIGFGGALLLSGRNTEDRAAPAPQPTATPPVPPPTPTPPAGPAGPGILREGDSGPEVTELQERLLRVPDVYRDGSTSGRYDATLTAAVARFQLWYGVRGDETGVYGDDTRLALESRTPPGA
ncbi:peptidoglycan-binding protein [Streptomyces bullii]|uniref:Peptidoglycan-binding protein n=1 Tax=Streptomyces bullii TaxID=349910 RepID=A0ABW0UZ54_9ACTN